MNLLPLLASLVLAGAAGCGAGQGGASDTAALMAPGQDCSSCHGFTVSGTVFEASGKGAEGVTVLAGGLSLTTNAAGNFFTGAWVTFPAEVEVRAGASVAKMRSLAPHGHCDGCHGRTELPISAPSP